MAKKTENKRCPLQQECERKCECIGHELDCDYYFNNGWGDNTIPDQEAIREASALEIENKILENWPSEESTGGIVQIPIEQLFHHPDNPRKNIGDVTELAESIKAKGILQNLTVVPGHKQTHDEWSALEKEYIGVERMEVTGQFYTAVNNDCVEEVKRLPDNSVDLIHTSIPFSNHYEYTPSYNDFGHNEDNDAFFGQMDFLTPELLRVLKPGRVAAIHVKDRILFGNATGDGMPTVDPFSEMTVFHFMKHGFRYMGRIVVLTDVVRENNQTYRLGWSEQCKDGTKMGVGCPEYVLLFRKLPTDTSKAYADLPVTKSKEEYTRAQWQLDAHAFWRSSGDRLLSKDEIKRIPIDKLQHVYEKYSKETVYDYEKHVELAKELDEENRLPATFMVVAPGSWSTEIWDDIVRMRTLNTSQSQKRQALHVCPLQLDIIERIINRYSNTGELVFDPFGGLMSVPYMAVKMNRRGYGVELNSDYFRDGVAYLQAAEDEKEQPTLFDFCG